MANKLELTWVGKEKKIVVKPRILIADPEKSHHAQGNLFDQAADDNMLIHGDNLLALKSLEVRFAGQVKCIYIDPPYNTGYAFEHYDDNLEHSQWLNLMRPRLEILRNAAGGSQHQKAHGGECHPQRHEFGRRRDRQSAERADRRTSEMNIELRPLRDFEEDDFIRENQIAFDKAAVVEFGPQKESVIPREDIVSSIHAKNAEAFRIIADGNAVGGVVVAIHPETQINSLYLLFVSPDHHSRGIGQQVWRMIEEKYPETKVWETHTPYFEKRNIHFYVNKCGFHIVEFFNPRHPEPQGPCDTPGGEYFFRFEKVMK